MKKRTSIAYKTLALLIAFTMMFSTLVMAAPAASAFAGAGLGGTLQSIRVDAAASRTEYHVGDIFSLADTVVYATIDGVETQVTGFDAIVLYPGAEATVNNIPASDLGLYRTGPRNVSISYTHNGVTMTANLQITVAGHRLYREIEFDLDGLLGSSIIPAAQRWGTEGRHWPAGIVFTMLNQMHDGTPFDMAWAMDPGVVLNVEFVSDAPINAGIGHDGVPHVRLGVVRGNLGTGTVNVGGTDHTVPRDAAYWNQRASAPPASVQERHYGSTDIRHRLLHLPAANMNGVALAHVNAGTVTDGGSTAYTHTMQGFTEDFLHRAVARDDFPAGWHYLVLFGGATMISNPNNYVTRVSLGMAEDRPAPWETTGWAPGVPGNVVVNSPVTRVVRGNNVQFSADVTGGDNPFSFVTWSVIGASSSTISPSGVLAVGTGEGASALTVRAASVKSDAVFGEFTIDVITEGTGDPIPLFDPLAFNTSNIPTYFPNRYGVVEANLIYRADAHTLPRHSMAFYPGWLQPGTVLTITYNLTGSLTSAFVENNIQFGIRRRSPSSQEFIHGMVPQYVPGPAEPGMHGAGAGRAWASLPVSTNPADYATHVIVDPVAGMAQVTFEALYSGLGANDAYLLANGMFFAPSVRFAGVGPGSGSISWGGQTGNVNGVVMSIGNTTANDIPWRTPITYTVINNDPLPNPGPLAGFDAHAPGASALTPEQRAAQRHLDPNHPSGQSLASEFPGDLGIGASPYVVRWDDFSEHPVGQITNVAQLNNSGTGRRRWDGVRLQNGSPGTQVGMFIVERGGEETPDAGAHQGSQRPISGMVDPYMPGDQAVVFWTNSEGPQHFSIELQQNFQDTYEQLINDAGQVHVRFYQYWAPNYAINGSSHNGVTFSALDRHRLADGAFGANDFLIPVGYDWYNIIYEFVRTQNPLLYVPYTMHQRPDRPGQAIRSPGQATMYVYYSWQASMSNRPTTHIWGDLFFADGSRAGASPYGNFGAPWAPHPAGWGTDPTRNPTRGGISPQSYGYWAPRAPYWPENAHWHSIELMVRPNTVCDTTGVVNRDGRITGWVGGEVVIDFPNIVLRYTEDLMLNVSRVLLINSPNIAQAGRETYKLITQYVMATRYIGPMYGNRHAIRADADLTILEADVAAAALAGTLGDLAVLGPLLAEFNAIEAAVALLPNIPHRAQLEERLANLWDDYLAQYFDITEAAMAATALEAETFGPITAEGAPIADTANAHALSQVEALVEAYLAANHANVTLDDLVFVDPPTDVPVAGIAEAPYEFTAYLSDNVNVSAAATLYVAITFAPEATGDASVARVAIEGHAFTAITSPYGGNAAARFDGVAADILAQINALALANVAYGAVTWVSPPTALPTGNLPVVGLGAADYQFQVLITGDDLTVSNAQFTVNVAFAPQPVTQIPRYNEIHFQTPSAPAAAAPWTMARSDWTSVNFMGNPRGNHPTQPTLNAGQPTAVMADGRPFDRSWFSPGVVMTAYLEFLDPNGGFRVMELHELNTDWFHHLNMGMASNTPEQSGQVMIRNQFHSAGGANIGNRSWLNLEAGTVQLTYGAFWGGPVNAGNARTHLNNNRDWEYGLQVMIGMAGSAMHNNVQVRVTGFSLAMDTPTAFAPWSTDDNEITGEIVRLINAANLPDLAQAYAGTQATAAVTTAGILEAIPWPWLMLGANDLDYIGANLHVTPVSFTAASAGTAGTPAGTNGSFTFDLTVGFGSGTPVTISNITLGIIATMFGGAADDHIAAAVAAIQAAAFADVAQAAFNTQPQAIAHVEALLDALNLAGGVTTEVNVVSFTAATAGTSATPGGTNGSFIFNVTVSLPPGTPATTTNLSFAIIAREWTPPAIPYTQEIGFTNMSQPSSAFPVIMPSGTFVAMRIYGIPRVEPSWTPAAQMTGNVPYQRSWFQPGVVLNMDFEVFHNVTGELIDPTTLPANTFEHFNLGLYRGGSIQVRNQIHSPSGATPHNRGWIDLEQGRFQITWETIFGPLRGPSSNATMINNIISQNLDYGLAVLIGGTAPPADVRIRITGMSLGVHEEGMTAPWLQVAPTITSQPTSQNVAPGADVTFTAAADGAPAPTFQWEVNDGSGWAVLTGEANATLILNNVTLGMNGNQYRAIATNTLGAATSDPATLTVTAATQPVFSLQAFNNGVINNPSLGNAGVIRIWTRLDGANAMVTYDNLTVEAAFPNGESAMDLVRVNRIWTEPGFVNLIDVNFREVWQYINLTVTYRGQEVNLLLINPEYTPAAVPVFSLSVFNNEVINNQSLANAGLIRIWTVLDGVAAPVSGIDVEALLPDGTCAMEFFTINNMWQNPGYVNLIDVSFNAPWQRIYLTVTAYGQAIELTLINPRPRVLDLNIFNNGNDNNQSLAAAGLIRIWTRLNGVNADLSGAVVTAVDQNGVDAMQYVRISIVDGNVRLIDVNKFANWQTIDFTITAYGQTVEVLLINNRFEG